MTTDTTKPPGGGMPPARALAPADMVEYAEGSIVSRTILDGEAGTLTLFAFDAGQSLSEQRTKMLLIMIRAGEAKDRPGKA